MAGLPRRAQAAGLEGVLPRCLPRNALIAGYPRSL